MKRRLSNQDREILTIFGDHRIKSAANTFILLASGVELISEVVELIEHNLASVKKEFGVSPESIQAVMFLYEPQLAEAVLVTDNV